MGPVPMGNGAETLFFFLIFYVSHSQVFVLKEEILVVVANTAMYMKQSTIIHFHSSKRINFCFERLATFSVDNFD